MSNIKQITKCNTCGALLEELPGTPIEKRRPCSSCGALSRTFEVQIEETLTLHSKLGMKGRHGTTGKPFRETVTGDDLHRKTGKWMHLERNIDRDNNLYKEVIKDPRTGEVVHKYEEPLIKHQGHGSAKKRSSPK
jgi:hypothetical protein